ncbi:MAG: TolC family protein [Gemmatimonadota bacterium]
MIFMLALMAGLVAAPLAAQPSPPGSGKAPLPAAFRRSGSPTLDSLVQEALARNPRLEMTRRRLDAARARIGPAGSLSDPVLTAGVRNLPPLHPGDAEPMNSLAVGLRQSLPFPGKRRLRKLAATWDGEAAESQVRAVSREVIRDVRTAYFRLWYVGRALDVVKKHLTILRGIAETSESRYRVGSAGQEDVLKARVEIGRLTEEAAALTEHRRAVLATLNALLDRSPETPVEAAELPGEISDLIPDSAAPVSFDSPEAGSRLSASPLPTVEALLRQTLDRDPEARRLAAEVESETARRKLAEKAHLPDFDVSLTYGRRQDRNDLLSLLVSVPIPVNRSGRQDAWVAERTALLQAAEDEYRSYRSRVRGHIAQLRALLERDRTRLVILIRSVIPQSRASLDAAAAGFQTGRTDFITLLTIQSSLFQYELSAYQAMSDLAANLAELKRLAGEDILS